MKHVCICTCSYTIGKHASGSPKFLCFFCTIFLYHIKHITNIYESEEDKRDDDNQSGYFCGERHYFDIGSDD